MKHGPENQALIDAMGHRNWVGGLWDEMGSLQFEFLISKGLQKEHVLLDIACGSMRAGRLFIPYLDPGNYLGIEKHEPILRSGLEQELSAQVVSEKRPEFVISDRFEFERFSKRPDFCIAQSLFTHLSPSDIKLCLSNLGSFAQSGCRLYATFFEARWPKLYAFTASHSHARFAYTRRQMLALGRNAGWSAEYIGDWKHPRAQQMVLYTKP